LSILCEYFKQILSLKFSHYPLPKFFPTNRKQPFYLFTLFKVILDVLHIVIVGPFKILQFDMDESQTILELNKL